MFPVPTAFGPSQGLQRRLLHIAHMRDVVVQPLGRQLPRPRVPPAGALCVYCGVTAQCTDVPETDENRSTRNWSDVASLYAVVHWRRPLLADVGDVPDQPCRCAGQPSGELASRTHMFQRRRANGACKQRPCIRVSCAGKHARGCGSTAAHGADSPKAYPLSVPSALSSASFSQQKLQLTDWLRCGLGAQARSLSATCAYDESWERGHERGGPCSNCLGSIPCLQHEQQQTGKRFGALHAKCLTVQLASRQRGWQAQVLGSCSAAAAAGARGAVEATAVLGAAGMAGEAVVPAAAQTAQLQLTLTGTTTSDQRFT
eukprot:352441-Chlamydomonas_euryale.AAC.5